MSGSIWGDLPANPRALRLSIEELERVDGLCFHEIENEVDYLECVALVLHEVKRLRWRPIATAPMDGTHVLVGRAADKPIRAWFEMGRWWMHGAGPHSQNVGDLTGPYAPTHWMPLPPAPCDGSGASRQDPKGLDPKDDSAVDEASSEVEAPDPSEIPTLKAEIERLTAALAEIERKRVEDSRRTAAFVDLARLIADHAIDPAVRQTANDLLGLNGLIASTPIQETTHVEG